MGIVSKLRKRTQSIVFGTVLVLSQITPFVAIVPRAGADPVAGPNDWEYWCVTGVKFDTGAVGEHFLNPITIEIDENEESEKTEVTKVVGSDVEVTKVVVKGGSDGGDGNGNAVYNAPFTYPLVAPENNGGQKSDVSHVIVCYEEEEPETGFIKVYKEVDNGEGFKEDSPSQYGFVWGYGNETPTRDFGTSVELEKDAGPYKITENVVKGYEYVGWYDGDDSCEDPDGTDFPVVAIRADSTRHITLCNKKVEVPEVDFCDPADRPAGMSIGEWLEKNKVDGSDCFELKPIEKCGSYDISFNNKTPLNYEVRYVIGDKTPDIADWKGDGVLPAVFPEDYNGGSVKITYYVVGEESDYFKGFGLPNIWDGNGKTVEVDTDCEENNGKVVVTKFNDENKNGMWDEGEDALPNWDIQLTGMMPCYDRSDFSAYSLASLVVEMPQLCEDSTNMHEETTDENGEATFTVDRGVYKISETLKEGWEQTGIYCDPIEMNGLEFNRISVMDEDEEDNDVPSDLVKVYTDETRYCYVGNYEVPEEPETPGQVLGTTTTPTPKVLADTGANTLINLFAGLFIVGTVGVLFRMTRDIELQ